MSSIWSSDECEGEKLADEEIDSQSDLDPYKEDISRQKGKIPGVDFQVLDARYGSEERWEKDDGWKEELQEWIVEEEVVVVPLGVLREERELKNIMKRV